MGYPETMRDIMEEVRRKEIENSHCVDHEHAEEFVTSANDAPSKGKQESNGK